MARGAGEPSAKRAKVDEAKEKEEVDRLVRRKEELVLGIANTRAEGMRLVREAEEIAERLFREADEVAKRLKSPCEKSKRQGLRRKARKEGERLVREAKERVAILESDRILSEARQSFEKELRSVCAELEAKNRDELLKKLPPELWSKIVDESVQQNDLIALAMTCRFFREKQKDLGKKVETNLNFDSLLDLRKSGKVASHTLGWFQWVYDTMEIMPGFQWRSQKVKGAVYKGDLLNYAVFQGSVETLRWLMEEKGWKLNEYTGWFAGRGGSIEVLGYVLEMGYEFNEETCREAAQGGHLEALKFLRGLDPPCPWDEWSCSAAVRGGHLDVLKWLRSQDPPCPWDEETCACAAGKGRLDMLKWLRDQDPPCPWNGWTCAAAAEGGHLDVLKWARSQDPPCPWWRNQCEDGAYGHLHVIEWIDQQEDRSDADMADFNEF
ncbi:hypothetical protein HKI87_14g76070 [Chloropicon roscoffensis]|uniref:F-box domain-containing protein n=1 Tax=Chloropicon roscoffensis TaxID=1461544 RepID=A0AAX4PIB3_9CHLO